MAKKEKTYTADDDAKKFLAELGDETEFPSELKPKLNLGRKVQRFLAGKKLQMKQTRYRRKYDAILEYTRNNLINTETFQTAVKSQSTNVAYSFVYENGSYTQIPILTRNNANDDVLRIPIAKEPVAFSKLMTAVAVLGATVPDATFFSPDKIYARTQYELWKRTWTNPLANGLNTLQFFYQNILGTGWGAYRIFPKKVQHEVDGLPRILFDDVYRQALDPARTWLGSSVNLYDRWSYGEVLYEIDQDRDEFLAKYPDAIHFQLETAGSVQESQIDESQKQNFVTIKYYENPVKNKYCVACGNYPIYEGEMPNEEGWGHVIWANCFSKEPNDPYGVGLMEIMRGNVELYDFINRLTAEQVEAEIAPLLFGTNTGVGEMTYRRGPNIINPKTTGTDIDVVKTSGNAQQSIQFMQLQKDIIGQNTGINDVLAGQAGDGTLGSTVIMKEAALNRLIIPRNNVTSGLEQDAYMTVSWIQQTYTTEKTLELNSDEEVEQFSKLNPNYFIEDLVPKKKREKQDEEDAETEAIHHEYDFADGYQNSDELEEEDDDNKGKTKKKGKKKIISYSKKVGLKFDLKMHPFDANEDQIMELTDEFDIPVNKLFAILDERGHVSDKIQIVIDPTSTLMPSDEINKQRITQLYQMVGPATSTIIQSSQQLPPLAKTLLTQLEHVLSVNKESIFDWFPKDVYDQVMNPAPPVQPGQVAQGMQGQPPQGGQPQQGGPSLNGGPMGLSGQSPTANQTPNPIGAMTQEFAAAGPQNPLEKSMQASMGRTNGAINKAEAIAKAK